MFNAISTHESELQAIHGDQKSFQLLLRITFVAFLLAALVKRLLGKGKSLSAANRDQRGSVIDTARRMANTILPFVFIR